MNTPTTPPVCSVAEQINRIDDRTARLMTLLDPPDGESSVSQILEHLIQQSEAIMHLAQTIDRMREALGQVLPILQRKDTA